MSTFIFLSQKEVPQVYKQGKQMFYMTAENQTDPLLITTGLKQHFLFQVFTG